MLVTTAAVYITDTQGSFSFRDGAGNRRVPLTVTGFILWRAEL